MANTIKLKTNRPKDPLSAWYSNRLGYFRFSRGAPPVVVTYPWRDPVEGDDRDQRLFVDRASSPWSEDYFSEATWNLGGAYGIPGFD